MRCENNIVPNIHFLNKKKKKNIKLLKINYYKILYTYNYSMLNVTIIFFSSKRDTCTF